MKFSTLTTLKIFLQLPRLNPSEFSIKHLILRKNQLSFTRTKSLEMPFKLQIKSNQQHDNFFCFIIPSKKHFPKLNYER